MPRIPVVIAHSPDADDAFMFYALACGKIPTGRYAVSHVLKDIETLNREAERGSFEVTALSFHQYPYVSGEYALLTSGGSFGEGYGPVVLARRALSLRDLADVTVAIPGERTTAALALRLCVPSVRTVTMPFDRIQDAVLSGEAEAGVIIHEGQLDFAARGLHAVADLGAWWRQETGLPLPLGGNAVRKDLGWAAMGEIGALIRDSIGHALAHREEALAHALQYARGLPRDLADRFVGMYVNARTLDPGGEGRRAVQLLLARARGAGLVPDGPPVEWVEPPGRPG